MDQKTYYKGNIADFNGFLNRYMRGLTRKSYSEASLHLYSTSAIRDMLNELSFMRDRIIVDFGDQCSFDYIGNCYMNYDKSLNLIGTTIK